MPVEHICHRNDTTQAGEFLHDLRGVVGDGGAATFDSADSPVAELIADGLNGRVALPGKLDEAFSSFKNPEEDSAAVMQAIYDGAELYENATGMNVPPDVMEYALHNVYAQSPAGINEHKMGVMDSATSTESTSTSLEAERAIVSVISTMAEPIPFAHYVPMDLGSGEAKIILVDHQAGNTIGGYAANDSISGVNSGKPFMGSTRTHTMNPADGSGRSDITGKLTTVQSDETRCDQSAGSVGVLGHRTRVFVDGIKAGADFSGTGSLSGTFVHNGTTYNLGGGIDLDTGEITATITPMISSSVTVTIVSTMDFSQHKDLIPSVKIKAKGESVYADPWHAYSEFDRTAATQLQNEVRVDPRSESILAINVQASNERHRMGLARLKMITQASSKLQGSFNLNFAARSANMNRSQMWNDFHAVLGSLSQAMVELNNSHGASGMYVTGTVAAHLRELPREIFTPSGIPHRAGIYRMGKLFGAYDVWYTPFVLSDTGSAAEILLFGRAADVARNGFVIGDAVPAMVNPIGYDKSSADGIAYYGRGYTDLNPHSITNYCAALISVTGLG